MLAFHRDQLLGLSKVLPPLMVTDQYVVDLIVLERVRGDLTCVWTKGIRAQVLSSDKYPLFCHGFTEGQVQVAGKNHQV